MDPVQLLIDSLFDLATGFLQSFIENDLYLLLIGMLGIVFILFGSRIITSFLNESLEEKEARKAFKNLQNSKGTWYEPVARKRYAESLIDYEFLRMKEENSDV